MFVFSVALYSIQLRCVPHTASQQNSLIPYVQHAWLVVQVTNTKATFPLSLTVWVCHKLQLAISKNSNYHFFPLKFACGQIVVTGNYCKLGVEIRLGFFKPWQIPHFTKILDKLGLLVTNSVHTKCRGKNGLSFHGAMKYNFHRQLPLRFCVLDNFSNKCCKYMTAFAPLAPPK